MGASDHLLLVGNSTNSTVNPSDLSAFMSDRDIVFFPVKTDRSIAINGSKQ